MYDSTHAFLSYVREDTEQVDRLAAELRAAHVNVWLDREQLQPGQRWQRAIRDAIRNGAYFLPCFSESYASRTRSYMNEEMTVAIDELRQRSTELSWLIPVLLSDVEVPDRDIGAGETLRNLQWVDLSADWSKGVRRLLQVIAPTWQSPEALASALDDLPTLESTGLTEFLVDQFEDGRVTVVVGDRLYAEENAIIRRSLAEMTGMDESGVGLAAEAFDRYDRYSVLVELAERLSAETTGEDARQLAGIASLPVRVFVTAGRTDSLEIALREIGRSPVPIDPFRDLVNGRDSGDDRMHGSSSLVVHIFGRFEEDIASGYFQPVVGDDDMGERMRSIFESVSNHLAFEIYESIARNQVLYLGCGHGDTSLGHLVSWIDARSSSRHGDLLKPIFQLSAARELRAFAESYRDPLDAAVARQHLARIENSRQIRRGRVIWGEVEDVVSPVLVSLRDW